MKHQLNKEGFYFKKKDEGKFLSYWRKFKTMIFLIEDIKSRGHKKWNKKLIIMILY